MYIRNLVYIGVPLNLLAACAFAQNCRPGSVELDVSMQCACVKNPSSVQCEMYKRNKSMYDGNGIQWQQQPGIGTQKTAPPAYRVSQPAVAPQQRTPVSAALLPADTPFWQMLPAGTRIAVGMRPQWMSASPLIDQLLNLGGQLGGQNMDAVRRELAGVDTVILSVTRLGGPPLILARAQDVVRATKSERDPYRYVDPDTILVGDANQTNAAMRRLFSQDPVSAEAKMAGRVAAWSDVWVVMDPLAAPGVAARLPGVTKMTVGLAMRDGLTMEMWLDTLGPLAAKNLAARLQKNPQGAPLFGQTGGVSPSVEQRGNSVRVYARVTESQLAGSPETKRALAGAPAAGTVKRTKVAEIQTGIDRAAVEAALGKPNSIMSIQGTDEPIETLIYNLDEKGAAWIKTVNGKVASVQFVD